MEKTTLHHGLEMRLAALEERLAVLRKKMRKATDVEKVVGHATIQDLETRHAELTQQVRELDIKGPGLLQSFQADFLVLADNLTNAVDDAMRKIDANTIAHPTTTPTHKS
jgi:DNA-binding protein YbaB